MGFWDAFATDPDFTDPDAAEIRYKEQIQAMARAKNWPTPVVNRLMEFPWNPAFDPDTAQQVYYHAWVQEPQIIAATGYSMGDLEKYPSHRNALAELAEASGITDRALAEADTTSVLAASISQTGSDVVDLGRAGAAQLDPKKSIWPWIIGGGVLLFILKELDVGGLIKERRS